VGLVVAIVLLVVAESVIGLLSDLEGSSALQPEVVLRLGA